MLAPRRPHFAAAQARIVLILLATLLSVVALAGCGGSASAPRALSVNPNLDPGSRLSGRPAPNFSLIDQFGRRVSLRQYRGKVVLLAFNDSECTTICPLTTTAMVQAQQALGPAGSQVQLLGIDANPDAITVHDVLSYSELHGMLRSWHFLTGSRAALRRVWRSYGIDVEIERGQIDHTPALFLIDPQGRMREVYLTQQSYAAVGQLGQLVAQDVAHLLPSHPRVHAHRSFRTIHGVRPSQAVSLARVGGGRLALGPGGGARLFVFFATWDSQVMNLRRDLRQLNAYARSARAGHLPALAAVDEASVEPSPAAITRFIASMPPLSYPVGLDPSGRVADGYEVQDEPWFVLVSSTGRILWYRDASTQGWPSPEALRTAVRAALAKGPPLSGDSTLSGSPAPLTALHEQGGELIGQGLMSRIHALRGFPVVVNIWASWCVPCQQEFGLFRSAALRFGRRVAFLGADYNDQPGNARAFLKGHRVSYPSYTLRPGGVSSLLPGGIQGTPTTFYLSPAGKVLYVHTGQYYAQGTLDQDVRIYAIGG